MLHVNYAHQDFMLIKLDSVLQEQLLHQKDVPKLIYPHLQNVCTALEKVKVYQLMVQLVLIMLLDPSLHLLELGTAENMPQQQNVVHATEDSLYGITQLLQHSVLSYGGSSLTPNKQPGPINHN